MKNRFRKLMALVCVIMMALAAVTALAEDTAAETAGGTAQETAAETAEETAGAAGEETEDPGKTEAEEQPGTSENTVAEATEEEPAPGWLHEAVEKFGETPLTAWIAFGTLILLGIVLRVVIGSAKKWDPRMISYGALSIALSFVLSLIRLFRMPSGGSVTPGSMLPIMLFAASYGIGPGMLAGLVYGLLQYLQGGWFLNPWQFILDYPLAFAMLGLAGLYMHIRQKNGLYFAIGIAALGRVACAFSAGLMWAADRVGRGKTLVIQDTLYQSKALYSIIYNGLYLIPETIICIVLAVAVGKQVMRIMKTK